MSGETDPRILVLTEMRTQTALLRQILAALAPKVAPSVDLDSPRGNPIVKATDPRDWSGEPMKGRPFSACPPEYLDLLAERYDYFAGKETDEKKAGYNRLDAARARGWAARLRAGWTSPNPPAGRVDETQTEPAW